MFSTVRLRLTLWYVAVFGLLLAGFSGYLYLALSTSLYSRLDHSLLESVQAQASSFEIETSENGGNAESAAVEVLEELRLPGVYVALFKGGQLLASNYPAGSQPALPAESQAPGLGSGPSFSTINGFGEEGARVSALAIRASGADCVVVVVKPLHDIVEQIESLRRIFYVGFPATLLIAGLGGSLLAKKSLAPVVAMSDQAARIGAENLHERLPVRNSRDELGRLAEVFNDLLSRLDQSFESLRTFIADASHELRTPLAIIRGEADVALSKNRDSADYQESLAVIQDEARRLSHIVDDMLALARADRGERPLNIQEFYLNDLAEECCRAVQVLAVTKGVSLTLDSGADLSFNGDEDLLRRMILNLLDNAIKYTPSGGSIFLKVHSESNRVILNVSDTGIGIPAEAAAHIFERFYRVDKSRSRAEGGSGLGLAIAQWVAEAHHGEISVSSEPGTGATFTISLPL